VTNSGYIADLTVDLWQAPAERWKLTSEQRRQARELFAMYTADSGMSPAFGEFLAAGAKDLVRPDHWREMESLSRMVELPVRDVVLCNLYYDALKVVLGRAFGCTAFAVDTPDGVLHARNLDWWTENEALTRYTATSHFVNAPAGKFTTIGWPGFVGVFSAVAPGRFAVTLNAVLSMDPAQLAEPVVLLIRTIFEEARTFSEARGLLSETPLPCDCLLLLTGVRAGEMVVIERTPARHALRYPKAGFVSVTNGYQALGASLAGGTSDLLNTWCQRFERVQDLIADKRPLDAEDCFRYLADPEVRMNMTVQQMVFCAATGEHWLRLP
jgi:hypothetical protein